MVTEVVRMGEVAAWLSPLLATVSAAKLACLFGGDRASCCDEAVVIKHRGQIIALTTIAPAGEMGSGEPAIVGVYTMPEWRRHGLGLEVLQATIRRCVERGLKPVRIDVMSSGLGRLVERLPPELKLWVNAQDMGSPLDSFPG